MSTHTNGHGHAPANPPKDVVIIAKPFDLPTLVAAVNQAQAGVLLR